MNSREVKVGFLELEMKTNRAFLLSNSKSKTLFLSITTH